MKHAMRGWSGAAVALLLVTALPARAGWWRPGVVTSWDWQLAVPVNPTANVQAYEIDMFENPASVIASLHAAGRKVICYVNVGSWENWRPDASRFPSSVRGQTYQGFPDERWLDIRRLDILGPLMQARFDLARSKGCDAIEPDNMDGYDQEAHESSGFPLTYADQLRYNRFIASLAHSRGMAVGLKNDINQTRDLVASFDFAVSEQCIAYGECGAFAVFIQSGKPVFEAEYTLTPRQFCPQANAANLNSILKNEALDAFRAACR